MKSWFKDLDLYKVIIILSVVLLPVIGGWAYYLKGELDRANSALTSATRRGGDLEEIGKWQKAVEEQKSSAAGSSSAENINVFFDRSIRKGQRGEEGGLLRSDFLIRRRGETNVGRKAVDTVVDIIFKREGKDLPLSRKFLLAVLFNSEASSQVWKLRELHVRNASFKRRSGRAKAPDVELEDNWVVQKMAYASRRPKTGR